MSKESDWRIGFRPHAVLQGTNARPSQITIFGITGGAERWQIIRFDTTRSSITYLEQTLAALPERLWGRGEARVLPFFGKALGFTINYSPDSAIRFSLEGAPLEVLSGAYRPGTVTVSLGSRVFPPAVLPKWIVEREQ